MKVGIAIHVEKDPYESIKKNVEETGLHNGQLLIWDMSLYNEENARKVKKAITARIMLKSMTLMTTRKIL